MPHQHDTEHAPMATVLAFPACPVVDVGELDQAAEVVALRPQGPPVDHWAAICGTVRALDDRELSKLLYSLSLEGSVRYCRLLEDHGVPVPRCGDCRRRHWSVDPCQTGS
jgi:hypothetical protein